MRMAFVILAGGEASRLCNKLMLSTKHTNGPMILSSIVYATSKMRNGDDLYVSLKEPGSMVEAYIQHLPIKIRILYDLKGGGFLASLGQLSDYDRIVVLCGDNIYPTHEFVISRNSLDTSYAVVRPNTNNDRQLDGYSVKTDKWITRQYVKENDKVLTTPWVLSPNIFTREDLPSSLIGLFNAVGVDAVPVSNHGWMDLGTEEAYRRHWYE